MVPLFKELGPEKAITYRELHDLYERRGHANHSRVKDMMKRDTTASVRRLLQGWNRAYLKEHDSEIEVMCVSGCAATQPHRICSTKSKPSKFWMRADTYKFIFEEGETPITPVLMQPLQKPANLPKQLCRKRQGTPTLLKSGKRQRRDIKKDRDDFEPKTNATDLIGWTSDFQSLEQRLETDFDLKPALQDDTPNDLHQFLESLHTTNHTIKLETKTTTTTTTISMDELYNMIVVDNDCNVLAPLETPRPTADITTDELFELVMSKSYLKQDQTTQFRDDHVALFDQVNLAIPHMSLLDQVSAMS